MKNMKKIISFVLITALMMTFLPAMALTAMASETGVRIELSNTTVTITEGTTATVYVPVKYNTRVSVSEYTYDIPYVLDVFVNGEKAEYTKTNAQAVPGTITVTADDTDYTLTLEPLGVNKYTNGGFEDLATRNDGDKVTKPTDWKEEYQFYWVEKDNPGEGTVSVSRNTRAYYKGYQESGLNLDVNKHYLNSSMARLDVDTDYGADETEIVNHFERYISSPSETSYGITGNVDHYLASGEENPTKHKYILNKTDWKELYAVICGKEDLKAEEQNTVTTFNIFNPVGGADATWIRVVHDGYFIGELTASAKITDKATGKTNASALPGSTIRLDASKVNQLGNKAGLGTTADFEFSLLQGDEKYIEVNSTTGEVIIDANAPAGIYKVLAETDAGTDSQSNIKGIFEITVLDKCTLSSLKVSNTDLEFSPSVTTYSVLVPVLHKDGVDTYKVPVVEAVALNEKDNVSITYPQTIPGNIVINVTDGEAVNQYTIALDFVGKNMYTNGGFENWYTNPDDGLTRPNDFVPHGNTSVPFYSQITEGVGAGEKSAQFKAESKMYQNEAITLDVDKIYISSAMVKLAKDQAITTKNLNFRHEYYHTETPGTSKGFDEGVVKYFDENGASVGTNTITTDWSTQYATLYAKNNATLTSAGDTYNVFKYLVTWGTAYQYVHDDYFMGELAIADIVSENNELSYLYPVSDTSRTIEINGKAVNNLGNLAAIKDKVTLSYRLAKDSSSGIIVDAQTGAITVPANYKGSFVVEAVAVPTWADAAQTNFIKQFEFTIGDMMISYERTLGGVKSSIKYNGADGEYGFINAVYNVLPNGEEEFVRAEKIVADKEDDAVYEHINEVTLTNGQIVKTFFWRWNDLTPIIRPYTFKK